MKKLEAEPLQFTIEEVSWIYREIKQACWKYTRNMHGIHFPLYDFPRVKDSKEMVDFHMMQALETGYVEFYVVSSFTKIKGKIRIAVPQGTEDMTRTMDEWQGRSPAFPFRKEEAK